MLTRMNIHPDLPVCFPGRSYKPSFSLAAGGHPQSLSEARLPSPLLCYQPEGLLVQLSARKPEASYCARQRGVPQKPQTSLERHPRWVYFPTKKNKPPFPTPSPFSSPQQTEPPKKVLLGKRGPACPSPAGEKNKNRNRNNKKRPTKNQQRVR